MSRLRAGDRDALTEILQLYWHPVVSYVEFIVENRDAAEDVAQDAFIRMWDRRSSWTATDSLRPFLFRIARNLALNARRSAESRMARLFRGSGPTVGRVEMPDEVLETSELQAAIAQALDRLPPRRREVFILARFHNLSYREIGEIMAIAPQTVANHLSLATTELQVLLKPVLGWHRQV